MSTIFPPFTLPRVKSLQCTILLYFTPLPWVARGLNGVIIQILVPEPTFFGWSQRPKAHAVRLLQSVLCNDAFQANHECNFVLCSKSTAIRHGWGFKNQEPEPIKKDSASPRR